MTKYYGISLNVEVSKIKGNLRFDIQGRKTDLAHYEPIVAGNDTKERVLKEIENVLNEVKA